MNRMEHKSIYTLQHLQEFIHHLSLNVFTHTENPDIKLLEVFDQKSCGGCLVFQSRELMGIMFALEQNNSEHIILSAQELLDYLPKKFPEHYEGTDVTAPFGVPSKFIVGYLTKYGICTESDYPFIGRRSQEHEIKEIELLLKYKARRVIRRKNSPRKEALIIQEIQKYPLIGLLNSDNHFSSLKKGEIYEIGNGPNRHAVMITGYGVVNGIPCYEVKNTWGTTWANNGFGLIRREAVHAFLSFNGVHIEAPFDDLLLNI